jgi:uroporphyrinogen decarboxylase
MSALKNDTFLRALLRQPTEYTPTWLMRQAGRYLPEYCATRARAGSFLNLCKSPTLATEVTLQPLARYNLDAAILFSDILTVPDAMGLGLYFAEGEGPKFERPLREEWAIRNLQAPNPHDHLRYVIDAVAEIRKALDGSVPLIGFSGSPFTLSCYMIEGQGSDSYTQVKKMMYGRPDLMHHILEVTTRAVIDYLNAQIEAGAQAVMVFDSWGGMLSQAAYLEFSLPYMARIMAELTRERDGRVVPRIVFTKGGGLWLDRLPPAAPMRSAWTGPSTSAMRGVVSVTRLRYKATWTPASCSPRRKRWPRKPKRCWPALATDPVMCSTWATAFPSSRRRRMSRCWWKRCGKRAARLPRGGLKSRLVGCAMRTIAKERCAWRTLRITSLRETASDAGAHRRLIGPAVRRGCRSRRCGHVP